MVASASVPKPGRQPRPAPAETASLQATSHARTLEDSHVFKLQPASAHARVLVCLLACAGIAAAHAPYLLPNNFDLAKRDHVSVQASFTEAFFIPDVAMKADDYHVVMPDGAKLPITPVYTKDLAVLDVAHAAATAPIASRRAIVRDASPRPRCCRTARGSSSASAKARRRAPDCTTCKASRARTCSSREVHRQMPRSRSPARAWNSSASRIPIACSAGAPLKSARGVRRQAGPGPAPRGATRRAEEGASAPVEIRTAADGGAVVPLARPGIYHVMARHRFGVAGADPKAESHTYAVTVEVTE